MPSPARIAHAMLEGFNRHYRLFPRRRAAGQAAVRERRLARAARAHASASSSTTSACSRRWRASSASSTWPRSRTPSAMRCGSRSSCTTSGCSPTTTSPSGRDLLQLGLHEAPAPQLLPQRLHLRAPGVSTEYMDSDPPVLPQLLPDGGPARDAAPDRHRLRARVPLGGPRARRATHRAGGVRGASQRRSVPAALARGAQFPDPGAVVAVLPQQGRLHRRQDHQRLRGSRRSRCRSCTTRAASSCIDTALFGEDDLRCCSQLRARLLHGRHGGAVGLRAVPALA